MAHTLIVKINGTSYRPEKDICAARLLDKDDIVILKQEPDNEHDPNAIQVMTRTGNVIGYVERGSSELLSQNFDNLTASVESIKNREIPFISIKVSINDYPTSQPEIVTDPNQMSATERMMILEDIVKSSKPLDRIPEGCSYMELPISWTQELPRKNVLRAKHCKQGDRIKFVLPTVARYPGRVEAFTDDDILIGYIDEDLYIGLADMIENIVSPSVSRIDMTGRICVRFYYHYGSIRISDRGFYDFPYKEVGSAQALAKEDPLAALDMIQYAVDHEKGITAKSVAMTCYWHLKDWESRRAMAQRMIDTIESIPEDELDPFSYNLFQTRTIPELRKNIESCDKKLYSKKKKK
mgnify:CR=1 FL=1